MANNDRSYVRVFSKFQLSLSPVIIAEPLICLCCTTSECRQSISVRVFLVVAELLRFPAAVCLSSQLRDVLQMCPNSRLYMKTRTL